MSLIFTDGFDLNSTLTVASMALKGWTAILSGVGTGPSNVTGRFGTGTACRFDKGNANGPTTGLFRSLGAAKSTIIAGVAFSGNYNTNVVERIIGFNENGTNQIDVRYAGGSVIFVSRNGTTLATQSAPTLTPGVFYYIEFKATIGPGTSGSYAVRINGATVAGIPDATGVNTSFSGSSSANQLVLANAQTGINPGFNIWDDLYVCDTAGSVNNDFLGDVRIIGILPDGGGTNTNWTIGGTSPAATNYQSVNENPSNGDITFVSSNVIGTTDTYNYAALPAAASQILAVVSNPTIRKDDAGTRSVVTRIRSGGTEADSPTSVGLIPTYSMPEMIMEVNPVTGLAWTLAEVNAMESGLKVAT